MLKRICTAYILLQSRFVRATYLVVDRLARQQAITLIVVGLAGFLASAAFSLRGIRSPEVHDEFAYLLAADTFAAGRLTNPTHPFWPHFESMHIIQQPSYMGKYPPGEGLVLALGQMLTGYPLVGVWISIGAACAAACWLLQGWLHPRWALLGGLLAVIWLAPTYWGQTYWGGAVAACGGALVYAALSRIVRQQRWWAGFHLGLGLAMMMYSRPYEGLVAGLPAAVVLFVWLVRLGIRGAVTRGLPVITATLAVLAAAIWLASYHAAVTGDPLVMPVNVHDVRLNARPTFLWQRSNRTPYRHPEMGDYYVGWERWRFLQRQAFFGVNPAAGNARPNFFPVLHRYLRPAAGGLVAELPQPLVLVGRGHLRAGVSGADAGNLPAAALYGPGHRVDARASHRGDEETRGWRWKGPPCGPLVGGGRRRGLRAGICRTLGNDMVLGRSPQRTAAGLAAAGKRRRTSPGIRALRTRPRLRKEWVYNRADIDGSTVVWAREISPDDDRLLREYFAGRKAWVVIADEKPPRLLPYAAAADAAYPRRPNPYLLEASNAAAVVR